MSATGICPGCGSGLEFRVATSVTAVCPYCQSIVVRGGAKLELVGKSNEVLVTGSVLSIGLEGRYRGKTFTLVGRTQLSHDLGGTWDEWLVAFGDGSLAWLAEHQGRYALTGEHSVHEAPRLNSPAEATPGRSYLSPMGELIVAERGEATIATQQGELPGRSMPGSRRPFVDFTSRDGRFATLDFGALNADGSVEPKRFFVGKEVTLAALGLQRAEVQQAALPKAEGASALRCTSCGAPCEKKLAESEALACGHCGTVFSVSADNKLGFLFAQDNLRHTAHIPLGSRAVLDKGFWRKAGVLGDTPRPWAKRLQVEVVGHVVRSIVVDGITYHFQEHLLHAEKEGFFWLVESDNKWLFVRNLDAGLVTEHGLRVGLDGKMFTHEQTEQAQVEQVTGELYWRVNKGDTATLSDFRHAPRTVSREQTANEVVWTECLDVDRADVERVFGIELPEAVQSVFNEDAQRKVVTVLVAIVILLFVLSSVASSGVGGGHRSYGGGGYSFGK